ncbi:MAG: DUF4252 domain-containing protein [Ignavibacteria bacterium]|jgi:hypothetical protein
MNKIIYSLIIGLFLSFTINAQTDDVKNEPGYVEFGDLTSFETSTGVTEVILDGDLLSVLATISDEEDPNIMAILEGLKLVKAHIFKVDSINHEKLRSRVANIDSKLSNTNWKRIVRTRSDKESASVYIKLSSDKKITGLVVTSFEKNGEAALINIVGKIDLATIGKLGRKFNIPHLEGIKHHKGNEDEN